MSTATIEPVKTQKARLTNRPQKFDPRHRRPNGWSAEFSVISYVEDTGLVETLALRIYTPGVSVAYACLWVYGGDRGHFSGSGRASGYGWHKPSGAANTAIRNAGIDLMKDIGGVGDSAIREALLAIAEAVHPGADHICHQAYA